jgi:hypothetical protein
MWLEGSYSASNPVVGWGLLMPGSGDGRQQGGPLHGSPVTWRLEGGGIRVAAHISGAGLVTGLGSVGPGGGKVRWGHQAATTR